MRFGVLGTVAVWTSTGTSAAVPGLKVRALLADCREGAVLDSEDVRLDRRVDVGLLRVARPATLGDRPAPGPPGHPHRVDLHRLRPDLRAPPNLRRPAPPGRARHPGTGPL